MKKDEIYQLAKDFIDAESKETGLLYMERVNRLKTLLEKTQDIGYQIGYRAGHTDGMSELETDA